MYEIVTLLLPEGWQYERHNSSEKKEYKQGDAGAFWLVICVNFFWS